MIFEFMTIDTPSVSYTHLDVYKRQQLVSCRCEGFGFERAAGAYLKAA